MRDQEAQSLVAQQASDVSALKDVLGHMVMGVSAAISENAAAVAEA
jgi:hypothetical protein